MIWIAVAISYSLLAVCVVRYSQQLMDDIARATAKKRRKTKWTHKQS